MLLGRLHLLLSDGLWLAGHRHRHLLLDSLLLLLLIRPPLLSKAILACERARCRCSLLALLQSFRLILLWLLLTLTLLGELGEELKESQKELTLLRA